MPFLRRPDGCRLYYETFGHRRTEPLVLLEGRGGDVAGWRRNIPRLSRELWVVAYDFRGNGRSDPPQPGATMASFIDDTVALLDHLELASAHVYGQSFGGMVAQELALAHPDRVRSLILAATHCGGGVAIRSRPHVSKDRPWLQLYSDRFAREHPDHVREDMDVARMNPQSSEAARRQGAAMQGFDVCDRLGEIRAPTLVLHGTEDRMVDPRNATILAERIPRAELVWLHSAGHLYHSEQPGAADRAVIAFVKRHADG
jgi:pimeloyl-ACP methyl ester carboxylesterase